ncbi:MAG: GAF domain-containing protein [Eubacterium sp.]|nr:GAF domain-containing protein [Eubacterium sp.]
MDIDITKITPEFLKSCKVDQLIDGFASACELYSVVLDVDGKILIEPSGPKAYLGEFYVTVTNPRYRRLYKETVEYIVDTRETLLTEVNEISPGSRFAAAPIFVDDHFVATWILYAHNKTQSQKLFKSYDRQHVMASCLSDIITKLYAGSMTMYEDKLVRKQLKFETQCKDIVDEILSMVISGDKTFVSDVYEKVRKLLNVDYIVFYRVDKTNPLNMILHDYWAKGGKSEEAEKAFVWDHDHYSPEMAAQIRTEGLVIDRRTMTNQMRAEVFNGNVKAIMVFPVFLKGEYEGRMIFIENSRERIWSKSEIKFAKQIADIVSKDLAVVRRMEQIESAWAAIKKVADAIPDYLLVRQMDGKIIFANSYLRQKLGEDIIGKDSRFILPMQEEFAVDGAPMETPSGLTVYQRYIDILGGIYDVTESIHKWRKDEKVSIVILEPANN